jgi:microcystin-dependent protein
MANIVLSPNMNLPVPTVGVDPGPDWATNIDSCLTILDQHNHTAGSGVQITPDGMNINADLPLNDNNLTLARSLRLSSQGAALALPTDIGCLYESGVDLYFNDGSGNQIRLTQSGSIVGTAGSISGLVAPASASYIPFSQVFVWQSAALTPANLDAGSIILRNVTASSFGLTLAPPLAMAADRTITLPNLPAATRPLQIDVSGNIGYPTAPSVTSIVQMNSAGTISTPISVEHIPPVGSIIMYGALSPPAGWLVCDGQVISRTTFAALFAVIGTTYSPGDGSTTFGVPNMSSYFPLMQGPGGGGLSARALGDRGGAETVTVAAANLPDHSHSIGMSAGAANGGTTPVGNTGGATLTGTTGGVSPTPANTALAIMNPFSVVNFIIKA